MKLIRVTPLLAALTLCGAPARAQPPMPLVHDDAPPALQADPLSMLFDDAIDAPDGPEALAPPGGGMGGGGRMPRMGMMGGGPGGRGGMGLGARMGGPGMGARRLRDLGLSADQRSRLDDIRDAGERRTVQTQADMRIAQLDLRKLMRAEQPDRAAIDRQIERVALLRGDLTKWRVGSMLEAREVLTPAQRQKLREGADGEAPDLRGGDRPTPRGGKPR